MPADRPPALSYVSQVRLSELQRRYLLVRAARERLSLSELLRQLVDAALAAEPPLPFGEDAEPGEGVPLSIVLQGAEQADLDELAARLEPWNVRPERPVDA